VRFGEGSIRIERLDDRHDPEAAAFYAAFGFPSLHGANRRLFLALARGRGAVLKAARPAVSWMSQLGEIPSPPLDE